MTQQTQFDYRNDKNRKIMVQHRNVRSFNARQQAATPAAAISENLQTRFMIVYLPRFIINE